MLYYFIYPSSLLKQMSYESYELSLLKQKISLVQNVMCDSGIDIWLLFTRDGTPDPIASLIGLNGMMARTAGIIGADGSKTAIAWRPDAELLKNSGLYDQVISYEDEGIIGRLKDWLNSNKPHRIAVNISEDFGIADGLTAGMKVYLDRAAGELNASFVSSEDLVITLRARLLPAEVTHVKEAIRNSEAILKAASEEFIKAWKTDRDVYQKILMKVKDEGLETAWSEDRCPAITVGRDPPSHMGYHNTTIRPGDFIRIDFGVKHNGYCSDIQHVYYVGGKPMPRDIDKMFEVASEANDAAIRVMGAGVPGYVPDEEARHIVLESGYPNYWHGTGHAVGLLVHEIGPRLAPKDSKDYAAAAKKKLQPGMVMTVEPSVFGESGLCNLEQDVLITNSGVELLSNRQEYITIIP
jgi:Xaa-Pro aminopeptidase